MKTRKMCPYWFIAFLDRLQVVLLNPGHFKDNEMDVLWLKTKDEYGTIKVPMVGDVKANTPTVVSEKAKHE